MREWKFTVNITIYWKVSTTQVSEQYCKRPGGKYGDSWEILVEWLQCGVIPVAHVVMHLLLLFSSMLICLACSGPPRQIWARQGPIFFHNLFRPVVIRAYWNPKSRQGPNLGCLACRVGHDSRPQWYVLWSWGVFGPAFWFSHIQIWLIILWCQVLPPKRFGTYALLWWKSWGWWWEQRF